MPATKSLESSWSLAEPTSHPKVVVPGQGNRMRARDRVTGQRCRHTKSRACPRRSRPNFDPAGVADKSCPSRIRDFPSRLLLQKGNGQSTTWQPKEQSNTRAERATPATKTPHLGYKTGKPYTPRVVELTFSHNSSRSCDRMTARARTVYGRA